METGSYPGLAPFFPQAADGERPARAEKVLVVGDKYEGGVIARLAVAGGAEVENAMEAAAAAAPEMAALSAGRRSEILEALAGLLEKHSGELAGLICAEAGKPIALARLEVSRAVFTVRASAAEALRFTGEALNLDFLNGTGKSAVTRRFPRGPVLCVTPFNFPLNLAMHKVAPAIAAGCPFIIKPSPLAPLSGLLLAALVREAGAPEGAAQAFLCENEATARMCADPRIAMLSFTGSDAVGWRLAALAARKKVCLELGGNAALVVDETVDLAAAARVAAQGSFVYAGQVCISTQRIYAVKEIFAEFSRLLAEQTESFATGDPREEKILCGPVIDTKNRDRLNGLVESALAGGARVLAKSGGEDPARNLLAPAILTNVDPAHPLIRDEAFGPLAVLEEARDFTHALKLANDTRYGLQAGVFTNLVDRMKQAHETLNVGGVIIGNAAGFRVDTMPYGGVKDSGMGREGVRYAMEEMTEPRLLVY